MQFRLEDISAEEVAARIDSVRPLTDSVRDLIDAVIRTEVDQEVLDDARARIAAVVDDLRAAQIEGSFGNPFTRDLVGMPFGNAAVGERNAIAPPMRPVNSEGVSTAEVTLGAAYEGPSGRVHGGVLAMDNALRRDRVAGDAIDDETEAVREAIGLVTENEDLVPALLPVGDGLLVAVKR